MPKVSEEHAESRRRQILDAAIECFGRSGLHGATIDDICTASGLSKGAVYGYFASKDDIVSAIKVESVQRDAAVIREATQRRDPEEAVRAMLEGAVGAPTDARAAVRLRADMQTWTESLLSQRLLDAQLLETQLWADALELVVQEAQLRGQISDELESRAVALTLAAVVYGTVAMRSWDAGFDPAQVIAVVGALIGGRVGGKPPVTSAL